MRARSLRTCSHKRNFVVRSHRSSLHSQCAASTYPSRWAGVEEGKWQWKGYNVRYQRSGNEGPAVLLVHGFGGNCDHWRKNTGVVGDWGRAYAIDLLGYGYSDKPNPRDQAPNTIYNFERWADQLEAFIDEVIGEPVYIIGNSIGGFPALQTAVQYLPIYAMTQKKPHNGSQEKRHLAVQAQEKVKGVQLLNISLRKLHIANQSPFARPVIAWFQRLLRETALGNSFFDAVAKERSVKKVLQEAYHDPTTVTDELVECILKPGLEPGAADVFLDFISYSSGPLPQELIPACPVPVSMVWGAKDPWEKVEWGRELAKAPTVVDYIELEGVGHCPQDEAPQLVNPLIKKFVEGSGKG